ncbi:MAG TPA: hypothetical protein VHQ87_03410, partial [Rhizobacter sp.]|nr:hypothetical protein [Rhizobacter sp.]
CDPSQKICSRPLGHSPETGQVERIGLAFGNRRLDACAESNFAQQVHVLPVVDDGPERAVFIGVRAKACLFLPNSDTLPGTDWMASLAESFCQGGHLGFRAY